MLLWLSLWVWDPILWAGPQGTLPLKTDLQASTFKQCVTLSTQEAGKAIFLRGREGIHRECVFRPLSCSNSFTSQRSYIQACPESLNSRVRVVCLRALSKPANTFLGHSSTAHEEIGYRSVSERAGCHNDVTSSRSSRTVRRTTSSPPRLPWNPASTAANLEECWFPPALREVPRVPCGNTRGNPEFPATTREEPQISYQIFTRMLFLIS